MSMHFERSSLLPLLLTTSFWCKLYHTPAHLNQLSVLPSRPTSDDREAWSAHWKTQDQPWRTEPEIDAKRQTELAQLRVIIPDIEKGIYPFKEVKLSRADVEWLLATYENGRGPVDWSDENEQERKGLDLRGADLSLVDLSYLPLARLQGGLRSFFQGGRLPLPTDEQSTGDAIHLENADLRQAHLEFADLGSAYANGAYFSSAYLEGARLYCASLKKARFDDAHLENVDLSSAHLEGAFLLNTHLEGAILHHAFLDESTQLDAIYPENEKFGAVSLADVRWGGANITAVDWSGLARVGEECIARQRKRSDKKPKRRVGREVRPVLQGQDLYLVPVFRDASIYSQQKMSNGERKSGKMRLGEHRVAARANRQLAVVLQAQGLNESATRFAYHAQILQRRISWFEIIQPKVKLKQRAHALNVWLFSWFLFLIAGYGYRPSRSFLAYLFVISGFATAYYVLGHTVGPTLSPLGAFVFSMTSFHDRGFFPGNNISLEDPLTVLAAFEALVGLIIEVTFIATLTQRFFNR